MVITFGVFSLTPTEAVPELPLSPNPLFINSLGVEGTTCAQANEEDRKTDTIASTFITSSDYDTHFA